MAAKPDHKTDINKTIRSATWLMDLLRFLETQGPAQASVGAGAIAAQIWNAHHGFHTRHGIKDIDVVYFDPQDLTKATEENLEHTLATTFASLGLPFDVKNQARVHLWYQEKFGYEIPPYSNLEDAVATWPTTATAVAVSHREDEFHITAPFGIADLCGCVVRPNKKQITEEIYARKITRWQDVWPELTYLPWD